MIFLLREGVKKTPTATPLSAIFGVVFLRQKMPRISETKGLKTWMSLTFGEGVWSVVFSDMSAKCRWFLRLASHRFSGLGLNRVFLFNPEFWLFAVTFGSQFGEVYWPLLLKIEVDWRIHSLFRTYLDFDYSYQTFTRSSPQQFWQDSSLSLSVCFPSPSRFLYLCPCLSLLFCVVTLVRSQFLRLSGSLSAINYLSIYLSVWKKTRRMQIEKCHIRKCLHIMEKMNLKTESAGDFWSRFL